MESDGEAMIASEERNLVKFKELRMMGRGNARRKGAIGWVVSALVGVLWIPCGMNRGGIHRFSHRFVRGRGECCTDTTSAGGSPVF